MNYGSGKSGVLSGTSRTADKFVVRLPEGLRDKISEIARDKLRSMNSQIITYLEVMVAAHEAGLSENVDDILKFIKGFQESGEVMVAQGPVFSPRAGDPVLCKQYEGPWIVESLRVKDGAIYADIKRIERNVWREETVEYIDLLPL